VKEKNGMGDKDGSQIEEMRMGLPSVENKKKGDARIRNRGEG
jgi:hypothetical protein